MTFTADTCAAEESPTTLVLCWTEQREHRVTIPFPADMKGARDWRFRDSVNRAARDAVYASTVMDRHGLDIDSIRFRLE